MPVILASSSPRRSQLLAQIGVKFEVYVKEIDENIQAATAEELVGSLSLKKAAAAAADFAEGIVIGADTVVALDGEIFGKPRDRAEARQMLRALSGKGHEVLTGFSIVDASGAQAPIKQVVSTKVYFRRLTDEDIDAYLDCNEYRDKAGAYAIQGRGAVLVEKIDGCFYNVVGLPLSALVAALKQMGVHIYE